jgi:hypothetical protein
MPIACQRPLRRGFEPSIAVASSVGHITIERSAQNPPRICQMLGYNPRPFLGGSRLFRKPCERDAKVAELVDALDLGSSGVTRESSSLSFRTNLVLLEVD